jgi:hypothetical protein
MLEGDAIRVMVVQASGVQAAAKKEAVVARRLCRKWLVLRRRGGHGGGGRRNARGAGEGSGNSVGEGVLIYWYLILDVLAGHLNYSHTFQFISKTPQYIMKYMPIHPVISEMNQIIKTSL